jgi:hypothetical protein
MFESNPAILCLFRPISFAPAPPDLSVSPHKNCGPTCSARHKNVRARFAACLSHERKSPARGAFAVSKSRKSPAHAGPGKGCWTRAEIPGLCRPRREELRSASSSFDAKQGRMSRAFAASRFFPGSDTSRSNRHKPCRIITCEALATTPFRIRTYKISAVSPAESALTKKRGMGETDYVTQRRGA